MQIQSWDIHFMSSTIPSGETQTAGQPFAHKGTSTHTSRKWEAGNFSFPKMSVGHWNKYPLGGLSSQKGLRIPKSLIKKKKILEKRLSMSLHSSPPLPVVRSNNALQLPTCSKKKEQSTQNSTSGDWFVLFSPSSFMELKLTHDFV